MSSIHETVFHSSKTPQLVTIVIHKHDPSPFSVDKKSPKMMVLAGMDIHNG